MVSRARTSRRGQVITKQKAKSSLGRQSSFSHGIELPLAKRPARAPDKLSGKRIKLATSSACQRSPFSEFPKPTAADVVKLHAVLARLFGERKPRIRKGEILDTIVGTILSQNTTNTNSHKAFQQLKERFSDWDSVRTSSPAAVEATIRCGGLAPKKTKWIQHILRTVYKRHGKTSMEYLRKMSKQGVHDELEHFKGVGKKTSAIINLFDVGHPDMAVDTHVFRYAQQLGWVPTDEERAAHNKATSGKPWPVVTRDNVYAHLDNRFPDSLKYSMHLILTDTVGGLPVVCGAHQELSFSGQSLRVDGKPLKGLTS